MLENCSTNENVNCKSFDNIFQLTSNVSDDTINKIFDKLRLEVDFIKNQYSSSWESYLVTK